MSRPCSPCPAPPPRQDVCRYDLFNVRLRLAVFEGADAASRYRLVSLASSSTAAASGGDGPKRGVYRGPAVQLLQPGGITTVAGAGASGRVGGRRASCLHAAAPALGTWQTMPTCCSRPPAAGSPLYALAVLEVPGMPEGRPMLLLGDAGGCAGPSGIRGVGGAVGCPVWGPAEHVLAKEPFSLPHIPPTPNHAVFIRTAHQPEREIAALVAAADGSTAFLLLPRRFWALPDVAPLVRGGKRPRGLGWA